MANSMRSGFDAARKFAVRMGQIPAGFKKLAFEFKDAATLYFRKQSQSLKSLRRKEEELIRSNFSAISKLTVYFFLQLPPIIGIIPTVVYLSYPRQLLTRHFWSEEEHMKYMTEEYNERRTHALKLSKLLEDDLPPGSTLTHYHLPKTLDSLPTQHIVTLAGANGICSTQMILNNSPSALLKLWLRARAEEIARDDTLLYSEGINELTPDEVQLACLRRGLNPCVTQGFDKLKDYLSRWIESPLSKHARTATPIPTSLLTHATALPEILLNQDQFEKFPACEEK